jgi:Mrp family chromosome partitioning ATPase
MGKVLETLTQKGTGRRLSETRAPAEPTPPREVAAEESRIDLGDDVPFIEVGGKLLPLEASPDVLASRPGLAETLPLPSVEQEPRLPRLVAPAAIDTEPTPLTVQFRPLSAGLAPPRRRFARELIAFHRPDDALAQQYRSLGTALFASLPAGRSRLLLFTAAAPGAGTTTTLLNLALTIARQGKTRVGVVDANRHQPAVAERLGLPEVPGLAEVLAGTVALAQVLQETGQPNLVALTAGASGVTVRLAGEATRGLLRQLRERFDLVMIDAPCWPSEPALVHLAGLCEGVYLVSPEAEADLPETTDLVQELTEQGIPLRGHLLTSR